MDARKGNRFWEARSSHGRKPIFANENDLWEACTEYFAWAEDNPLIENKVTQFQGEPVQMTLEKMRAMTISGMCTFLGISIDTWSNYRIKKDFILVVRKAEQIIYDQKFSGASADLLNANIIARDLGLVDKKESNHTGSIMLAEMSDSELEARKRRLEKEILKARDE